VTLMLVGEVHREERQW